MPAAARPDGALWGFERGGAGDGSDRLMAGSLYVTRPTLKDYLQHAGRVGEACGGCVWAMQSGELQLRMGHRYRAGGAAQAHRDLEARKTTGKVLLMP